ncbi:hypothetical protein PZ897_09925 [Hoeflea sp. YIM 152468]|uniref:hypothetical protein n=1 Tax=Hoeflea sp. YIM 152468 TaxID=3031759 RepID=UPI0023DA76AB|nr:hypothetical protein [Hoeflea sp. YIM 152468]MDF1608493.1 hypothetical protein [Hoeflea sp. YIM 152468]
MSIRRVFFLCFLAVTLGLTGPFARGISSQAAVFPQSAELSRLGTVTNLKTSSNPTKRCQRGAITWSNCSLDTGDAAPLPRLILIGTADRLGTLESDIADALRSSRIFRPPRLR